MTKPCDTDDLIEPAKWETCPDGQPHDWHTGGVGTKEVICTACDAERDLTGEERAWQEALNAPRNTYGLRWCWEWPHISLGVSAHVWPPKFAHLSIHLPFGLLIVGCRGVVA